MSESFGLAVLLYASLLALACAGLSVTGGVRPPVVLAGLALLQGAVCVQAVLDAVALSRAEHAETVTNLGYLVTSVAVIPLSAAAVRLDTGRWGSAALAVGCALLAVVSLRLHATLGPA